MEDDKNKLENAVEALKNEKIPPGPSQEVIESTIAKLTEKAEQSDTIKLDNHIQLIDGLKASKSLMKIAAAAVLLIVAGYATGRFTGPQPPDMEQIQAVLEPKIRQKLLDETKQYVQLGLTSSYIRIKDELSQQYREELNRVAMQSVAASNAVTNELLTVLIESFNEAQSQDRQRIAAALEQIESNMLKDRTEFGNALATLALETGNELMRTQQDMAHFLSYTQPDGPTPDNSRE